MPQEVGLFTGSHGDGKVPDHLVEALRRKNPIGLLIPDLAGSVPVARDAHRCTLGILPHGYR